MVKRSRGGIRISCRFDGFHPQILILIQKRNLINHVDSEERVVLGKESAVSVCNV
jgi:hypothetical protein